MQQPQAKFVGSMLVALAVAATSAPAVIQLGSPSRNLGTPADAGQAAALALQGQIGDFSGTPIAPNLFIAAAHASALGRPFHFDGRDYTASSYTDVAGTDLRVFQIDTSGGAFSRYATIYDARARGSEVGKSMFVAGRGTDRGAAYTFNGETRGYYWDNFDHAESWGAAAVDDVVHDDRYGDLVSFGFATSGLSLTGGDSGGGLFVYADGKWQLAGVNLGVDGPWSRTAAGPYENASIFDARGLYAGPADSPTLIPTDEAVTGSSYASRISSNRAALNQIFHDSGNDNLIPEPATFATVMIAMTIVTRRARRRA